jgi:hypothetical protein
MEKQWNALIEQIRQPKTILILVFLLGLLFNGSLYFYRINPQFLPMHNLSVQYNQLEKQQNSLEILIIPPKISPVEINKLVEQVPISMNTAAFLLELKELETQSGVEIELVSDGSNAKINAANELINSEGKANLPNASYDTQPKPTAPATTATGPDANFNEQSYEITIVGQYAQLMDFINRLKDLPRIVNVKEWEFGDGSSGSSAGLNTDISSMFNDLGAAASPVPQANDTSVKKRIKLKLSIYSSTQFKDKFPDLPPASVKDPENRLDPTISDDQFNKLLESP